MDNSRATAAVERLLTAIHAERLFKLATPELTLLLGKMADFYEGKAPAPNVEDFIAWTKSVEQKAQVVATNFGDLPSA